MTTITIDSREKSLISQFEPEKESISIQMLELGDIHIQYQDIPLEILIERKTQTDLWNSIIDSRYKEQRARLLNWSATNDTYRKIIYLIEMDPNENTMDISKRETLEKTLHRLTFVYHIMIYRVYSISESKKYILWLSQQKTLLKEHDLDQDKLESWKSSILPKKKDIQTSENFIIVLLMCIQGISYSIANQLTFECKTIVEYIEKLKKTNIEEFGNILISKKKLGLKKATKIYSLLGIPY